MSRKSVTGSYPDWPSAHESYSKPSWSAGLNLRMDAVSASSMGLEYRARANADWLSFTMTGPSPRTGTVRGPVPTASGWSAHRPRSLQPECASADRARRRSSRILGEPALAYLHRFLVMAEPEGVLTSPSKSDATRSENHPRQSPTVLPTCPSFPVFSSPTATFEVIGNTGKTSSEKAALFRTFLVIQHRGIGYSTLLSASPWAGTPSRESILPILFRSWPGSPRARRQ